MQENLVKYLAGLLDSDGCLSFEKKTINGQDGIWLGLCLALSSSDAIDHHGFVLSLAEQTGFGCSFKRSGYKTKHMINVWRVRGKTDLEKILPRLIKHQIIKAKHWQWMLDNWREYRSSGHGNKSLTEDQFEELKEQSKKSRSERVGPIKPKNHPTWAWTAGFIDGDGYFSFRTSRNNNMRVGVTEHMMDASALYFLQKAFGGTVRTEESKPNLISWSRGLGPAHSSFALRFLPNLVKHSKLKKHKMEQIIHWHRQRLTVPSLTG